MEKILANTVYSDSTLKRWKKEDLIEHIRILEHNWACSEERFANSVKNADKIFYEQRAKIERLTEEKRLTIEKVKSQPIAKLKKDEILWAYQMDCGMYEAKVDELQKQVEKLTEERNEYTGLYETMYRKWSNLSDKEFNCDALRKEKNEYLDKAVGLQKQVDELKEERQTLVDKYNKADEAVDYWCERYKQAVKDTAKEILTLIKNGVNLNGMIEGDAKIATMNELRWAGQKYGVEVE